MIVPKLALPVSLLKWKSLSESLLHIVLMYHHDGELWMSFRNALVMNASSCIDPFSVLDKR